jgi:hypothetical protein
VLAGVVAWLLIRDTSPAPVSVTPVTFAVQAPSGAGLIPPIGPPGAPQFALSPDGRTLAFVALERDGRQVLYVRPLASQAAQLVAGTDGATMPFWSPDGRSLAFFARGEIRRVDAAGGVATPVCTVGAGFGGTWSGDTIAFADVTIMWNWDGRAGPTLLRSQCRSRTAMSPSLSTPVLSRSMQ